MKDTRLMHTGSDVIHIVSNGGNLVKVSSGQREVVLKLKDPLSTI